MIDSIKAHRDQAKKYHSFFSLIFEMAFFCLSLIIVTEACFFLKNYIYIEKFQYIQ
jgi:hypothetical protein